MKTRRKNPVFSIVWRVTRKKILLRESITFFSVRFNEQIIFILSLVFIVSRVVENLIIKVKLNSQSFLKSFVTNRPTTKMHNIFLVFHSKERLEYLTWKLHSIKSLFQSLVFVSGAFSRWCNDRFVLSVFFRKTKNILSFFLPMFSFYSVNSKMNLFLVIWKWAKNTKSM